MTAPLLDPAMPVVALEVYTGAPADMTRVYIGVKLAPASFAIIRCMAFPVGPAVDGPCIADILPIGHSVTTLQVSVLPDRYAVEVAMRKHLSRIVAADCPGGSRWTKAYDGPKSLANLGTTPTPAVPSAGSGPSVVVPGTKPAAFVVGDDDFAARRRKLRVASTIAKVASGGLTSVAFHAKGRPVDVGTAVHASDTVVPVAGIVVDSAEASFTVAITTADSADVRAALAGRVAWLGPNKAGAEAHLGTTDPAPPVVAGVPPAVPGERMFHNPESASGGKFWGIRTRPDDRTTVTRFGGVGAAPRESVLTHAKPSEARDYVRQKIESKKKEGYVETENAS